MKEIDEPASAARPKAETRVCDVCGGERTHRRELLIRERGTRGRAKLGGDTDSREHYFVYTCDDCETSTREEAPRTPR